MVTKSFENSIMNTTPFSIFCDILLPTNRRTKKDASAVPHPILRILLILSQIVILRPRIRDSLQQPMRLHSYEIRSSIFTKIITEIVRIIEKNPCTNFHEDTSISVSSQFLLLHFFSFLYFFLFFFLILFCTVVVLALERK